jgi:tripartite-type tricarboxylate transporter receptor subunit TctC
MNSLARSFFASACGALAALSALAPAAAQTGADFYKDKTVTYIVATAPGGGYDTYARLIAEYMQRHLPGATFVVKNVPGAGHLVGTNALYASKPDGLTIGTFNTGLIYNQLIKLDGVRFDLTKMSWIGKASSEPRVMTIAQQSPIKSFKDLREQKEPVNFATAGVGSAAYVETVMLTNALRLPIKILTGYSGHDDELAMRRGEIVGVITSRSTIEAFVKNGYGRFIAQIGGNKTDYPQLKEFVTDPDALRLISLVVTQADIQRFTAGPPGIPQDRLDALRGAYRKALEDPELRAKAAKLELPIDPAYGDDVLKLLKEALEQSPQTIALLKSALEAPAPSPAQKGTIAELNDDNRKVVLKLADGKTVEAAVSGSRTEITVGGQKGDRKLMKVGMKCAIEVPNSGAEAKTIACD